MSIWQDFLHINGELAHWLFEAEGLLIGVAWHWLWQRRHDRKNHSVDDQVEPLVAEVLSYGPMDPAKRNRHAWLSGAEVNKPAARPVSDCADPLCTNMPHWHGNQEYR